MDYKTSGVDVEAGRNFVNQIKSSVESTFAKEVVGGLGGFGGCFRIPEGYKKPILVSGTDGVGTKLDLAQLHQSHFGVGIDLVAMCVNDVITSGAKPLFFLDYIATGSLEPESLINVVKGISEGCRKSGCALLGGETAEMPGFYQANRYDLAGFCVAIVEESDLVNGHSIQKGDVVVGIESSGFHSNGFSLVRKVLEKEDFSQIYFPGDGQLNLIETLLEPTYIYVDLVKRCFAAGLPINGMAHITGGGLPENLPRCFPKGLRAKIDPASWQIPKIFRWLQDVGDIPEVDIWNTFNLGIGFCLVVPPDHQKSAIELANQSGFNAWSIGLVEESLSDGTDLIGLPY